MPSRRPNPRLVKIHRNYTVEEIANLFDIHKNTVRIWIKQGLPVCDKQRPAIILGRELQTYLYLSRTKNKQPCQLNEMYCLRCRKPQKPAADMVEYQPTTEKLGNLIAICPDCNAIMNRRVSLSKLPLIQAQMHITFPQALKHIDERS